MKGVNKNKVNDRLDEEETQQKTESIKNSAQATAPGRVILQYMLW